MERHKLDAKKKLNLPNKELKRINDLLAIIVVRWIIHLKNVGVMEKKNSMENVTIAISMVKKLMNVKRNRDLKANVTNVRNMETSHQNAKPRY